MGTLFCEEAYTPAMLRVLLLAVLAAVAAGSFMDFLNDIKNHSSFKRLPEDDKLLFGQLVVAAENDELRDFIDRTGLTDVLKLMDHMSQYDAERFAAYLAEHSNYTHHAHGHEDVINKRDHDDDDDDHHSRLWSLLHGHYHSVRLPDQEKATLHDLMEAAKNHEVTKFVNQAGYGTIFGLLEHAGHFADEITEVIENAMASEASSSHTKRQSSHGSSHGSHHSPWNSQDFWQYFTGQFSTQYYEHLPDEEKATYHALTDAAKANNLTGYIAENGYGPIFGFLEHLDYVHANQVYDYLEQALESEKAAAASSSR